MERIIPVLAILAAGGALLLGGYDLTTIVLLTLAFIAAITVHEGNHALVATALGDDTPRRAGRLSLNPMRHIDMMGLIMFVIAGFGWGWTPINPMKLRPNPKVGGAIVAAAGPLANLALAALLAVPLRMHAVDNQLVDRFFFVAVQLNILLFCFNLIPLPPLDGFSVLVGLLPREPAATLKRLERYGPGVLLVLLILPSLIGINVVGNFIRLISPPVTHLIGL